MPLIYYNHDTLRMTTWKEILDSAPPVPQYKFSLMYWPNNFFKVNAVVQEIPLFKEEEDALEVMEHYYSLSGDLHLVITPESDLDECLEAVSKGVRDIADNPWRRCHSDEERREIVIPGLFGDLDDVVHKAVPWCRVSAAYLVDVDDGHITPFSKADIDMCDDASECHNRLGELRIVEAQIILASSNPKEWEDILACRDESMLFDLWYSLRTPASDCLREGALERWHMALDEAEGFLAGKGY